MVEAVAEESSSPKEEKTEDDSKANKVSAPPKELSGANPVQLQPTKVRDSPEEKAPRLDDVIKEAEKDASDVTKDADDVTDHPSPSQDEEKKRAEEEESKETRPLLGEAATGVYHVKWVGWGQAHSKTPIVTQNENGPCPLLSIVNILLLRGKLRLPEGCDVVSAEQLLEYLGDVILEGSLPDPDSANRLDYEQNVNDAIGILPKLQTGLDVNVRFTGVCDFEYTPECIIFDLLNISLYHGWLMDPQNQPEVVEAIQNLTYNQLVEKIISQKHSEDSIQVSQSLIAQQFLEESASQLTIHGLCELMANIREGELAVFFRNNHFSAIYKEKTELFLLVTDQGFLKEPRVVWETLSSIDGDGHFVDDKFVTVPPSSGGGASSSGQEQHQSDQQQHLSTNDPNICDQIESASSPAASSSTKVIPSQQQIDRDHRLVVTLAEEDEKLFQRETAWEEFKAKTAAAASQAGQPLTDEELAKKLQDEEDMAAAAAAAEQQQQQQQRDSSASTPSRAAAAVGGAATPPGAAAAAQGSRQVARQSGGPSQRTKNCVIL